jgi:hypothetical protein
MVSLFKRDKLRKYFEDERNQIRYTSEHPNEYVLITYDDTGSFNERFFRTKSDLSKALREVDSYAYWEKIPKRSLSPKERLERLAEDVHIETQRFLEKLDSINKQTRKRKEKDGVYGSRSSH